MEDLISAISGNMHVSQDGYELKALQEYLKATIALPSMPLSSPANAFRPLPPSRSASSTRKHPIHQPQYIQQHPFIAESSTSTSATSASYPSPGLNPNGAFWNSAEDVSMATPAMQRPNNLRRTSSYGFGGMKEFQNAAPLGGQGQEMYSAFQDDAFAPLCEVGKSDEGGGWKAFSAEKANPWAAFSGSSGAFGSTGMRNQEVAHGQSHLRNGQTRDQEEEEAMDEDWADQSMDEVEDEDSVEAAMDLNEQAEARYEQPGYGQWEVRGRRSF